MGIGFEEHRGALSGVVTLHYRIGELIGAGGMGEVYRATDTKLRRTVAIKSLPNEISERPTVRERFVREARLAGRVSHPYIATVFDIIDNDDRLLLVMEYIEGKTLGRVLVDEKPSLDQSLEWCHEITEALQAIHAAGVIHRDLKPGNIMVMPSGHTKLMDFGLARQVAPLESMSSDTTRSWEAPLTAEGAVLGTLLYMSPEQLRGEELDPRSDLFSLGTVLYQVLSGIHPFARANPTASAAAILHEEPGPPGQPDPLSKLPETVRTTIRRLLCKESAGRFDSCAPVLDALRDGTRLRDGTAPEKRRVSPLAIVLVLALATVMTVGGWNWLRRPPTYEGPRVALAVLAFEDQTGDEDGPLQAGMAGNWLAAELESSHLARTAGPSQTTPLVRSLQAGAGSAEITRRVAAGVTVDYVLIGTLFRDGRDLLATLEIEPTTPGLPPIAALQARGATPLQVAEQLASRLRRHLPEVSRIDAFRDRQTGVEESTSESPEARLLFEKGLTAAGETRFVRAIEWFRGATETDSTFALAWVHLADALDRTGYARQAREAAERAGRVAPQGSGRAEQRLALRIDAVRARVYDRSDEAIAATDALTVLFPDEPALVALHGRALMRAGRYEEAVNRFGQAIGLDPLSAEYRLERAEALRETSRQIDAESALREAESLYSLIGSVEGLASVKASRARILWDLGLFEQAVDEQMAAATLYEQAGRDITAAGVRLDAAQIQLVRGYSESVAGWIGDAEAAGRRFGNKQLLCRAKMTEAGLHHRMRQWDEAIVAYADAVDLARQLENDELMADPLANLGPILVYRKRREEARGYLAESVEVSRRLGRHAGLASALAGKGQLDYHLGAMDQALAAYNELIVHAETHELTNWQATGHRRKSTVYRDLGELDAALTEIDAAVSGFEAAELPSDVCKALLTRASQLAWLGRDEGMRSDLDRAATIVEDPDPAIQRLAPDVEFARAEFTGRAGDWNSALVFLSRRFEDDAALRKSAAGSQLACDAYLGLGKPADALAPCEWAVEREAGSVPGDAAARARYAEALLGAGRHEDAAHQARLAFDAAEQAALRLPLARAAAVLSRLPPDTFTDGEDERIRTIGARAIEEYLSSAPSGARRTLEGYVEISRVLELF